MEEVKTGMLRKATINALQWISGISFVGFIISAAVCIQESFIVAFVDKIFILFPFILLVVWILSAIGYIKLKKLN